MAICQPFIINPFMHNVPKCSYFGTLCTEELTAKFPVTDHLATQSIEYDFYMFDRKTGL